MFNTDLKALELPCGSNFTLFLRDDIVELEAAAKKFEQEGVLQEIQEGAEGGDDLYSYPSSNMFDSAVEDGYSPYCEIILELNKTAVKTEYALPEEHSPQHPQTSSRCTKDPEVAEASLSSAASTLCSFVNKVQSSRTHYVRPAKCYILPFTFNIYIRIYS